MKEEALLGGGPASVAASPPMKRVKPAQGTVGDGIIAPMPGKIADVLVKPGDEVEAGRVVVILGAMKMENNLSVVGKGTVKAVAVAKGDSVQSGQVLVILE
jgi:biotin carboxyl carrier protein